MILLKVILALSTAHTSAASNSVIWPISWPLIADSGSVPVTRVQNGYGDWCVIDEGPHPGLDFSADITDNVVNPSFQKCYSLGYGTESQPQEHILVLGHTESEDYGWTLGHIYCLEPWIYWNPNHHLVLDWNSGDSISFCGLDASQPGPWRHLHLSWVEDWVHPPPGGYSVPGYTNPFDHIVADLTGYDEVQFKSVLYEKSLWPNQNTGAWFMPDGTETTGQISGAPGSPDYAKFQDIVSGAIDIAVSPFSAFQGISDYDSAGVYSVSYEILWQDPNTLDYLPAASGTDNYGQRWLMQMRDELPFGDTDEFRAIYLDGSLPGSTNPQAWWDRFESAYIVTNSGALDPASWITSWDNVWTNIGFVNDWTTGICQGAWDTFLAIPDIWPDPPTQNSEAFFPDGRYAVKVTAVSHGSRDTDYLRLPVDDLALPNPQVEGVIVDNFLPHIARVAAYTWDPAADTCHKIYAGHWDDIDTDRAWESESEYLEQLRSKLHAIQLSSDQIDALPSHSVLNLPESFSQSSIEHNYQAERSRLSREYSDGTENFEPGCYLDEGIGQDPAEFLIEEIARIENQQVFDADRIFDDRVYGYLPMNGMPLVLKVFYSEPTKTDISDRVYFRSYIGPDTSSEYTFRRLSSDFELPLPQYNAAPGCDFASSDVLLDSSYVVYYIYKNLPQYYQGNILLYFGDANLQDDKGPRDLAGNTMDSDPSTIANTRNNYGPFSNEGYEGGQDTHYSWNPPNWFRYSNTVYGTVGIEEDLVATVDLDLMGLDNGIFIGDCDYWCGFWFYHDEYDEYGFDIYVFMQNLIGYIKHSFNTPYPVGMNYEQSWLSNLGGLSRDTRYYWMTGSTIDLINFQSTAFAYCVDSETGAKASHHLCTGYCFWGPRFFLGNLQNEEYLDLNERGSIYFSGAEVLDIDTNGVAQIEYWYFEILGDTSSCVVDTTYLSPPGDRNDALSGDMFCASDICTDAEEVIEILSNPVRETLGVRLIGETGEDFELILYDIAGRRVLSESGVVRDDESVLNIRVENLPSGVYLLRMRSGSFQTVRTISIVR